MPLIRQQHQFRLLFGRDVRQPPPILTAKDNRMSLIDNIQTIAAEAEIELGLACEHIETGEQLGLNQDLLFPMASVLKIPVLACAFHQWDDGYFRLEDRWTLHDDVKAPGSGILPSFAAGLTPTVWDLLTLMIIISDNTATDMIIDRLGGPLEVEKAMHALGLRDIYLKLNIKDLLASCLPEGLADQDHFTRQKSFHQAGFRRDSVAFSRTPDNNVSTPLAMTNLLSKIYRGEIASQAATDHMLDILGKQQFNQRLPRFLPPGTPFFHKTGTLGGSRNDSGLLTLAEDSHVSITLYTIWDDEAVWHDPVQTQARIFAVESAMGHIGRLIHNHFAH